MVLIRGKTFVIPFYSFRLTPSQGILGIPLSPQSADCSHQTQAMTRLETAHHNSVNWDFRRVTLAPFR